MKKLLQKLLFPTSYFFHVNLARLQGVVIPWFRPRERALQKTLKSHSKRPKPNQQDTGGIQCKGIKT